MTEPLTPAENGVKIHAALTGFFHEASKGKSSVEATAMRNLYTETVQQLVEATGVRVSQSSVVESMTTDERAVVLAQAIVRAREFINIQTRTRDFSIIIPKMKSKIKNLVDHCMYDHLCTVTTGDGRVLQFALSDIGQYVLCDNSYWEQPPV